MPFDLISLLGSFLGAHGNFLHSSDLPWIYSKILKFVDILSILLNRTFPWFNGSGNTPGAPTEWVFDSLM